MAEQEPTAEKAPEDKAARGKDEVALELMKFIAVSTGYARAGQSGAGFSGKGAGRSPEEHADALLELFERCRQAVRKES